MKKLILGDLHREEAPAFSEAWGIELPRSYCDEPGSEYAALHDSVGLLDESYRGVLDFTGADAGAFLDKVVSSPLLQLADGGGQDSCLLSAKGRLLGAFTLYRLGASHFRAVLGEPVREGQVLVVLAPTAQEGSFAQARGRVEGLVVEVQRSERLFEAGAIPRRRLEDARHDLEVARAELDAMGGSTDGDYSLSLRAPITGVVAERSFLPGSRVEAGEPLFTIVDPSTAWLRVQMSAVSATDVPEGARATFTIEDSDEVFETSRRLSVGNVMNPETRTVPVVFEVGSARGPFTFGQLAQASVPTGGVTNGIAIPNDAILDDNGTVVAYVQTGGETFARRVLTLGARDGSRTEILAGLDLGERVVTVGAYQVRLASLSGGDFAGGHGH